MSLTLYSHPLASFCHKVLIALYENDTPFTNRLVDLSQASERAELEKHWGVGKFPVLIDASRQRTVPESTPIVEYLSRHYPGRVALMPQDADECFDARLWDRFFDCYVQTPMQKIVGDRLRPEDLRDPTGVAEARALLATAYTMLDAQLRADGWAVSERFTLADCSAAPALFYAGIVEPWSTQQRNLAGYFDRLVTHPSVQRTLAEARPYFQYFPFRSDIPKRFL